MLVFKDTDRWLRGAFAHPETLLRSFCGRVLPELRDLPCSIVMAVHEARLAARRYRVRFMTVLSRDGRNGAAVRSMRRMSVGIPWLSPALF